MAQRTIKQTFKESKMSCSTLRMNFTWRLPLMRMQEMTVNPQYTIFCPLSQILHLKISVITALITVIPFAALSFSSITTNKEVNNHWSFSLCSLPIKLWLVSTTVITTDYQHAQELVLIPTWLISLFKESNTQQ